MQGYVVLNVILVVAVNRVGIEDGQCFYGIFFICDYIGEVQVDMD